ncbi:MAG: MOSC domain-containing protein [Pegethrix bostrychoides GSE-TBD4-15B]|jgi:hypothetical protein|uniref:MOSC domain-containing protein n=1 Tax=Pegethrix bostrychoides GSE-TBD4-15B TaxID=2839662 RepID=A0A951PEX9_9CYAN|nr:MOSC domain-containing protein [Pegethrix bostrychoides GSE-TBD4-15B]
MTTAAAQPVTLSAIYLSAIYIYPVKSCRGIAVSAAQLDNWGLQFDRNWMIVNTTGRFLSQRELPKMALIEVSIGDEALQLTTPGQTALTVPLMASPGESRNVEVWGDRTLAIDQGETAAAWLSETLGQSVRLVRLGEGYSRPVKPAPLAAHQVSFADGYPLLLISEASLADLNQRLPEALPMNRFRPNLVVSGCEAYAEDSWQQIRIDSVTFDLVSPCERCAITTTDQDTGSRAGTEPLKTLATYRRTAGGVIFGQNLVHQTHGEVRSGSPVEILL